MDEIVGIHHVTAASADLTISRAFYTKILGLAEVANPQGYDEQSICFASVSTNLRSANGLLIVEHLSQSDPKLDQRPIGAVVFGVAPGVLPRWRRHLLAHHVKVLGRAWVFGEEYLCFADPDGLDLALVEEPAAAYVEGVWDVSDESLAILRLRSVELDAGYQNELRRLLSDLGLKAGLQEGPLLRYTLGASVHTAYVDLLYKAPSLRPAFAAEPVRRLGFQVATPAALERLIIDLSARGNEVVRAQGNFETAEIQLPHPTGIKVILSTARTVEA